MGSKWTDENCLKVYFGELIDRILLFQVNGVNFCFLLFLTDFVCQTYTRPKKGSDSEFNSVHFGMEINKCLKFFET